MTPLHVLLGWVWFGAQAVLFVMDTPVTIMGQGCVTAWVHGDVAVDGAWR